MALETLKGVEKIGGFEVAHDPIGSTGNYDPHIGIFHEANAIVFKIQDGPIKEHGVNGCQVDTLIHAAKKILEGLNEKFHTLLFQEIGSDSEVRTLWDLSNKVALVAKNFDVVNRVRAERVAGDLVRLAFAEA